MTSNEKPQHKRNKSDLFDKSPLRTRGQIPAGTLIEFQYGTKKKLGESGGWKNDPRPVLLVFYDDKSDYIEGVNTNYLSDRFLEELVSTVDSIPGIKNNTEGGMRLYKLIKDVSPEILRGYRKYKRKVIKTVFKLEFKDA